MQEVEEIARFKVPKYLSAYIDVLKFRMQEMDLLHKFPENLKFELYLEFGVGTKTLLTLIGLGLSRTSAIAINEFLGADDLDETQIIQRLTGRRWTTLNIPAVVKREIEQAVRRIAIAA